ncbi:ABC transporter, permease [Syntrophomonas zehnderi OL-4]|uniref:ABC transporter, permease n=1 Tax=Syntrophomonas zehnderi OL-4 TaxID=690567 RepID=A0A0E4GC37_9FIRM|nr:branched-chain amino acid ABC transporter permease [Syntrophomonas zehnderi]CFY02359.1 ABC transporter, permease [Syntrophomonas zehnderi OL-4]
MTGININKNSVILAVLVVLLLLLPMVVTKPYYLHVIIICLLWAYLASCWNIIGGFAGQLSLGHGIYTAIGAYITVILFNTFGLSPWLGLFVGGGAAILLSLMIGYPTFGLRGAYYALATVAISEGIVVLLNNTGSIGRFTVGGAEGLIVKSVGSSAAAFQFNSKIPYYYIVLIMLFLIIFIAKWIKESKLGYYLVALREDEDAAAAMGINVRHNKLIAGAISAFFTALGGVFYAMLIRYLEPNAIAGASMSTQMVFLAIVGGSGTVLGPVIGGILLALISEIIRFYLGGQLMGLHLFIYGMIVLLMIIYQPRGIIELFEKIGRRFSRKHNDEGGRSGAEDPSGA